jgi:ribosomal protein S18 acetylase RimI-like enzyme
MIDIVAAQRPEELEAVRDLIVAHAASLRDHPGSDQVLLDAAGLPGPYAPPRGRCFLARLQGEPVGCVALRPLDDRCGEVKRLFVRSSARRHGVARQLMDRLLADAFALGYRTIRLGTLPEMTAAQDLYRRLGFVEIPRYRADELIDTVFFEKHLPGE